MPAEAVERTVEAVPAGQADTRRTIVIAIAPFRAGSHARDPALVDEVIE